MIKKLKEHTYGNHVYMQIEINGNAYEIDCFYGNDGARYKTTADGTDQRDRVIKAFKNLY